MQPTKDCVAKTLKRLEEKIHGRVSFLLYYWFFLACIMCYLVTLFITLRYFSTNSDNALSLQVLKHLLYLMRVSEKAVQTRVALALAHLCAPDDRKTIFIHNSGTNL